MIKRNQFILGIIVLVSGMVGFFSLTRGHPWWDDFAGYLLQAKNILTWTMGDFVLHNTFTIQNSSYPPGPVAYPWGFPLLLSPVYAVFGLNPLALKLVGLFFFMIFLICVAKLASTRLPDEDVIMVTGLLAFAPALLAANDLILSDIPFLAISTLSLFLLERFSQQDKPWQGWLVGLAISLAFFLRTNGILLLAPLVVSQLSVLWPNWQAALRRVLIPILTFSGLTLLQFMIFPGGEGSYFSHFSMFNFQGLLENVIYYLWLPTWIFDQVPGGAFLYLILIIFFIISLYRHWQRDQALHVYGFLTVLLFILWPERQGLRFIYPVIPFLFISAFDGMRLLVDMLKKNWQVPAGRYMRAFWGLVLLVFLGISSWSAFQITAGGREINGPFDQYSKQMYAFIRDNTPAKSVMIFMRPRALRLFTDRDAFMTEQCSDLVKGDYLILHQKMEGNGQIPPEKAQSCNPAVQLQQAFQNKRFIIFKITQ